MTRKEFLKMAGILGIGIPVHTHLSSCKKDPILKQSDKVIIIGAGAGGLASGYLLNQRGIDFQILEASSTYGGRMKRTIDFTDFPVPLGAEWLHVERGIFDEVINNPSIQVDTQTTPYDHDTDVALYEGETISLKDVGFTIDQKFINSTWFDFFDQYIVPSVESKITYNKVIDAIDYSSDQIIVKAGEEEYTADRVIINIPVKMLQNGAITFTPALPSNKRAALSSVKVWDGCKAFIQFSEKFYPAVTAFNITPESAGEKLYYDAAYGQNSDQNVLGLFAVGTGTEPYVQLSDTELKEYMLAELDQVFDGKASQHYIKHIFQNWNAEPFIQGAYPTSYENWRDIRTLGESVNDKLFFAGCAYTDGEDWSSVHTAARSALSVIQELAG